MQIAQLLEVEMNDLVRFDDLPKPIVDNSED